MSNRIRKTSSGLVANSLSKAAQAIKDALIDADCNDAVQPLLSRGILQNAITHMDKVAKELLNP